ncbi:MAG: PrsW family intramembrane metalloprotease, partial [Halobacteriaceae archaeon]
RQAAEPDRDLYDLATWEVRTPVDRIASAIYRDVVRSGTVVVILAILILLAQVTLIGITVQRDPLIAIYITLSIVPALALALFVGRLDVSDEPLTLLVGTFLLGFLFAGFAAIVNSQLVSFAQVVPFGMVLFFFFIVGPVEEFVKILAVRLYAYRSSSFHAVIDGAVYGAMAGLGFATIENSLYITQRYVQATGGDAGSVLLATAQIAVIRTFAGPGHVIYSAFAGYYLGLAKFNSENAGPIIVKGLLIATIIHGLYNTLINYLVNIQSALGLQAIPTGILFILFVLVYDGVFGFALYRKLSRYRRAFRESGAVEHLKGPGMDDELQ